MIVKKFSPKENYLVKLDPGEDLLNSITAFVEKENITSGYVNVMGLARNARYAYYNICTKVYEENERDEHYFEIIQCMGNISVNDGKPFPHLHIAFGDQQGAIFGGHLLEGTIVEIGEMMIQAFNGEPMEREYDDWYKMTPWKK
jgi:uncharacterized protein